MLISNEYRKLNTKMHRTTPGWGAGAGKKWGWMVEDLMLSYDTTSVLDYGCGKGHLQQKIRHVTCYDPNVPQFANLPAPHDIVVCFDVLEHVEPECIDDVLEHIRDLTKVVTFLNIATRKGSKKHTLPDGRNAHLIVEDTEWWKNKLEKLFMIRNINETPGKKLRTKIECVDFLCEIIR